MMNHLSLKQPDKARKKFSFKAWLILLLMLFQTAAVFGEDIKTIQVVTPSWTVLTNEDGTGLLFDIVRAIYEPVGIKMDVKFFPWKRVEHMIETGKADAMLDVYHQNITKNMIIPKYPMIEEYSVALFRKDKIKKWEGIKSLDGLRAIWFRGYDFHKSPYMKGVNMKWDEMDDQDTAWRLLKADRTDVYIDTLTDMQHFIKKNKVDMTLYQMENVFGEKGFMAFSKSEKSEKLIEIYNKRIIELFKSGELERIFEKWKYPFPAKIWSK